MLLQGLKFGLLLQIAVGPVCLMVFNTASSQGWLVGIIMALAVTIVDALYIALAALGISSMLAKDHIKNTVKICGCIILILFGVNSILGSMQVSILPNISLFSSNSTQSAFMQGLLLTLSNPLTIVFWGGVFSAQIVEKNLNRKELLYFAIGCICSTISFLSFISILGSVVHEFISTESIKLLNIAIGLLLIYFGIRLVKSK